jgi:predicted RNase H-like HicB family nuclease
MSTATVHRFTVIIHREEEEVVYECSEVHTVSQGDTVEDALVNLREARDLSIEEFLQAPKWQRR